MSNIIKNLKLSSENLNPQIISGKITSITGMTAYANGINTFLSLGDRCEVDSKRGKILSEVVGFSGESTLLLPFGTWDGVSPGNNVNITLSSDTISPSLEWKGRVINALAQPIDGNQFLPKGSQKYFLKNSPPNAFLRKRVGEKLETCIKSFDVFTPICRGQRMGIFAGSGVGKSSLLSMLAKNTNADIIVIGLVGERGREVQEFIQEDLGEEGLKKSVLVVSTGDEPPLMRRQAAWTAVTVAEFFRDQGLNVLLLIDSVTRFAMAQREIGLSAGEPPTTKGYPPTVFSELPRLLERAGPGTNVQGDITGMFTVLVDGDDHNEPISDTVRGILDGHIVLDRKIADKGRYPAINLTKSVSRMLPDCHSEEEYIVMRAAKSLINTYEDMEELIRIGAYREGTNFDVDVSIKFTKQLESYLNQRKNEKEDSTTTFINIYKMLLESGAEIQLGENES